MKKKGRKGSFEPSLRPWAVLTVAAGSNPSAHATARHNDSATEFSGLPSLRWPDVLLHLWLLRPGLA